MPLRDSSNAQLKKRKSLRATDDDPIRNDTSSSGEDEDILDVSTAVRHRQDCQGDDYGQDVGNRNDDEDDDDEDDDDEDDDSVEEGGGNDAAPVAAAGKNLEAPENHEAASASADYSYSDGLARKMMKVTALRNNSMILNFVVNEVFKDMKFTDGDDDVEMQLVKLAIDDGYVKIDDPKIKEDAFITEYYHQISKCVTLLRQRAVNAARKKFQGKFDVGP